MLGCDFFEAVIQQQIMPKKLKTHHSPFHHTQTETMGEDDLEQMRRVRELRLKKQALRVRDWQMKGELC